MNYFGLIFSFLVPGVILGLVAAAGIGEASARRRSPASAGRARGVRSQKTVAQRQRRLPQARRLYVYDLAADRGERAA